MNQDTLDGIKGGTINATVAQKPFTMGYIGLRALDEIFHSPPTSLAKDYSQTLSRRFRSLWTQAHRWWTSTTWMPTSKQRRLISKVLN